MHRSRSARTATHDRLGRLVEARDPLGRKTVFERNEAGALLAVTSPAGERVLFEREPRGRVVRRRSAAPGVDDRFAWDAFGRLVSAANAEASYTVEHDALDRPVALRDAELGTARRVYDADGRITQVVYPAADGGFPDGVVTHYRWDARGALTSVVDPQAGTWQFAWDAAGRPVARRFPGDVRSEIAYDARGFVASVEIWQGATRKDWLHYQGYDGRGNPGAICEGAGNCTAKTEVAYDALGRVTEVTYPGGASERFAYDAAGTRVGHTDRAGVERRYVHDAGGELVRIEDAGTGALLESYDYDDAGRRTQRTIAGGPTTQYAYDPLGRLASVDQTGPAPFSLALAYDPAGHRRRRTDDAGIALYLGEWLEQRGGKRIRLVHAPGVDDVLAEVEDAPTPVPRYLLADASGNVVQVGTLAGSTGTVEATRRYFAFGEVRSQSSPFPPVERGFAGRPSEGSSGLLYLRARHYDPRTGAFLQPDPLGIATDHPYAYASSNPFVYADPWGLLSTANKAMNAQLSGAGSIAFAPAGERGRASPSGGSTPSVSMGSGGALGTYTRLAAGGNVATDAASVSQSQLPQLAGGDPVAQAQALRQAQETGGQSFLERLGFGLSQAELNRIDREIEAFGAQIRGPVALFAKALKIEEALVVPLAVTGTGLAVAGVGIFAVATAPVSAPAALFLGGAFGLIGGGVTAVGLDLGATQINETFGTSLPSTGLLPPIRPGRLGGP